MLSDGLNELWEKVDTYKLKSSIPLWVMLCGLEILKKVIKTLCT